MQLKTGLLRLATAVASLLAGTNVWAITQDANGVYQIGTADDLYEFAQIVNGEHSTIAQNMAANAILTSNIVVNSDVINSDGTLNGDGSTFKSWTPIGKVSSMYSGTFNGKGHTISGLYINATTNVAGLFGAINNEGKVDSIGVLSSYFKGKINVGGVCGSVSGTVKNCYNTGTVIGSEYVGGVCGYSYQPVTNCYNTGTVIGSEYVGGVCGYVENATVKNCYNTGSVNGSSKVGGVCGIFSEGSISNCYNTGSVNGSEYVGSVCGAVSVGLPVSNCYCTGETIVGYGEGTTTNCSTKTLAQFRSGEVAYLLSQGKDGDVWGQKLGSDSIPMFSTDVVYAVKNCKEIITGYTNTKPSVEVVHVGDDYVNGFCPRCDAYQPAIKNSDGVYEIGNAGQLYWFASLVNDSTKTTANAVLTADITVNKNVLAADGSLNLTQPDTFRTWTPIGHVMDLGEGGSMFHYYHCSFNGKGHTVSGLYVNNPNTVLSVGLFGLIGTESKIDSVGVLDSYFKGKEWVGGVCGYNSAGIIRNCYNAGSVSGSNYVGGVCGYNSDGIIRNCYNAGSVSGSDHVGGVCGYNLEDIISNCYNAGSVSGSDYVGGVCGYNNDGTVTNCYNTGSVSGSDYVGGVCSYNSSTISNCYNDGSVSGSYNVGGVCGYNYYYGTVSNCYCTGETIVGYDKGTTTSCSTKTLALFKSGEVAYLLSQGEGGGVWGQKLGTDDFPVFSADVVYAEREKCNSAITGYTNTKPSIIEHDGDDYVNGFCPRCDAYQPATKNSAGVYEIGNAGQLYWFASLVNSDTSKTKACAILTADITVNKDVLAADGSLNSTQPDTFRTWTPIADHNNPSYSGTFNGKGYTVSGLYSTFNSFYVGLFGYLGFGGKVDSIGVLDSYFKSNTYAGGVCGENHGTVTNCYNTGSVSGEDAAGGVCGENHGTVTNCYNAGNVNGSEDVGGVCGVNINVTITNCFNTGNVSGISKVGGVCGYNEPNCIVINCYNIGSVDGSEYVGGVCGVNYEATVSNCYCTGVTIVGEEKGTTTNCSTKTTAQFKSGEVAYLLSQGEDGDVWGQKLGSDSIPMFSTDVVYAVKNCKEIITGYTNTKPSVEVVHVGDDYVNGFCPRCDAYQPATKNSDGVYEIGNAGQLYWFASLVNDSIVTAANAILTADITVNKNVLAADGSLNSTQPDTFRVWTPIGKDDITPYSGIFNGNGHIISGLYYNSSESGYVGLFGFIISEVKSVGVSDSYFKGRLYVGGVCGYNNQGTVTNCYNTGSVSGRYVGGVCGFDLGTGIISNCYNTGSVIGSEGVGGVCGYVYSGTVKNCYNMGSVNGSTEVGAVCGVNYDNGTVSNCYCTGETIVGKGASTNCSTKTLDQFKSGEVAYLLSQGEGGGVWGQKLGTDTIPVFSDDKVYLYENCLGISAYTNDESKNGITGGHDFSQKVLTDQPNAKSLYAYVCANDASHISNYNVIKAYNGKDNLELDSTAEGEYFVEKLALRDTESFNSPVDFTANTFSYDRKPAAGIVTFMLPIDVPSGSLNGTAYYLKQFDGSTLKFKRATEIKANTPYVVKVNEKGDSLVSELNNVTVKATTSINETTVGNATHFGSYVSTTIDNDADYDYYGYKDSKFYRGKVGVSVAPFRSAVKLAKATSVVGNGKPRMSPTELNIEFDDDDATGIEITPAEIGISGKVNVYDVLGRAIRINVEAEGCLDGLQNGVYIVNGKKVIVRE